MEIAICNLVVDTRSIAEHYHNLISLVVSLEFGAVRVCPRHAKTLPLRVSPTCHSHPHCKNSPASTLDPSGTRPYTTPHSASSEQRMERKGANERRPLAANVASHRVHAALLNSTIIGDRVEAAWMLSVSMPRECLRRKTRIAMAYGRDARIG